MSLKKVQVIGIALLIVLSLLSMVTMARTIVFVGTGVLTITIEGNTTIVNCDSSSSAVCKAVVEIKPSVQ
jgi:hypothetical protein